MNDFAAQLVQVIHAERQRLASLQHKARPGEDGSAFFQRICREENEALAMAVQRFMDRRAAHGQQQERAA